MTAQPCVAVPIVLPHWVGRRARHRSKTGARLGALESQADAASDAPEGNFEGRTLIGHSTTQRSNCAGARSLRRRSARPSARRDRRDDGSGAGFTVIRAISASAPPARRRSASGGSGARGPGTRSRPPARHPSPGELHHGRVQARPHAHEQHAVAAAQGRLLLGERDRDGCRADVAEVSALLTAGADPNEIEPGNGTPLHRAVGRDGTVPGHGVGRHGRDGSARGGRRARR